MQIVRCQMRRRALEREMFELASRLGEEPERRCAYQRLLDERMRLAAQSAWSPPAGGTSPRGGGAH